MLGVKPVHETQLEGYIIHRLVGSTVKLPRQLDLSRQHNNFTKHTYATQCVLFSHFYDWM